ncbi:uncharacterized protein LOC114332580 [Diabrotica virgifera virgifera]|uniref:Uncharacterized protein n=1 Tax=Diabrotica virgifera virgifera TaxID=50390 RepID=A0ABM5IPL3_DIAVI|nr:uncharacterized protein LOC114332580 [Diabrotica virgifera virgifera]
MILKIQQNAGTSLYIMLLCFPNFLNGLPKNREKRSFMDSFMGISRGYYNPEYEGSNLIQSFLAPAHQINFQRSQDGDFILHVPFEEEAEVKFLNVYQDPDCPPNQGVEFIPYPPRTPTRYPSKDTVIDSDLVTSEKGKIYKYTSSPTTTLTNDNPMSVKVPLTSIVDSKESTDMSKAISKDTDEYVKDTQDINISVPPAIQTSETTITQDNSALKEEVDKIFQKGTNTETISTNIKISDDDEVNPVIPIIPVNTQTNNEKTVTNVYEYNEKLTQNSDNIKEGWIQIPKLHYHPATTNSVENTNEVSESSKSVYSFLKDTINNIPSQNNVPFIGTQSNQDLPTPNFDNLEDLLNRTRLNNTTVVYTRSIDLPPYIPNGLSAPPTLGFKENNYLTAPDPSNPPAPLNRQPNTLLIDDWLEMSRKMYNKLSPEDKRKVYEANKAVVTGKYRYDNDDISDVKMKLLKDNYLVADRIKDPAIDVRIKGGGNTRSNTIKNYFDTINSIENETKTDSELRTNKIKLGSRIGFPEEGNFNNKPFPEKSDVKSYTVKESDSKKDNEPLNVKEKTVENTASFKNNLKTKTSDAIRHTLDKGTKLSSQTESTVLTQTKPSFPTSLSNIDNERIKNSKEFDDFERPVIPDNVLAMFDPNFDDKDTSDNEIQDDDEPSPLTTKQAAVTTTTLPPIPLPPPPPQKLPRAPLSIPRPSISQPPFPPSPASRPATPNIPPMLNENYAHTLWSSASNNIAARPPPPRRPIYRPSRPINRPTSNDILAEIFSQIVEGVTRTIITETARNYGGPAGMEFIRRLGL